MAENVLGRIILDAGNQARGITGGGAPPVTGLLGDAPPGGGSTTSQQEAKSNRFQKGMEVFNKKSLEFAAAQPKWFTAMFKKMGIQMGLAGILKQSQIFTSTIGAFFQIFGAMVDVMLAPLIRPVILPILRWLARQIPTISRASKAFFAFIGKAITGIGNFFKKFISGDFWTNTVFKGLIDFFTETFPQKLKEVFDIVKDIGAGIWGWFESGMKTAWNSTLGGQKINFGPLGSWTIPNWGGGSAGTTHFREKPTPPGAGKGNTKMLEAYDKDGNLIAVEDLTTIEGGYKPNERVREWLEKQGADPVPYDPAKGHITVEGGKSAGEDDKDDRSWWQKIFDPNQWKSVFGDFKKEFKDFWSGSAISNVLKGAGVVVGGSLGVNVTNKLVSGMGKVMKGIMWTPKQLVDVLNATLKTPGMMGLNTAKWAVRQLNLSKGAPSVIGTVRELGLKEGAVDLVRRALGTMGSGVSNAVKDAWNRVTEPVRLARNAASRATNIVTRGRFGSPGDALRGGTPEIPRITGDLEVPRTSPRAFDPSTRFKIPRGMDVPTGGTTIDTSKGFVTRAARIATDKFSKFYEAFSAFIRGASSWTVNSIQEQGGRIARLGDEAFQAAKSAGMGDIMGRITMLKSFVGRLVPFAASGIALATTGKNIADISNMEHLSWWTPHAGLMEEKIGPLVEQMADTQKQMSEGGAIDKIFGSFAMKAQSENLQAQSVGAFASGTKAGAITTQALMGTADALLGFGGAVTLPLQAGIMGAQYGHMKSVQNWNQKTGEYTGTLDQLMSDVGGNMDAATIQLAIEQGMSKALERAKVQNVMSTNHMADIGMIGIP